MRKPLPMPPARGERSGRASKPVMPNQSGPAILYVVNRDKKRAEEIEKKWKFSMDEHAIELLKWGIGGGTIVAVFWKFIPSLFDFLARTKFNEPQGNGAASRERHNAHERRLARLEQDHHELREIAGEIGKQVAVSAAIVDRLDKYVCAEAECEMRKRPE